MASKQELEAQILAIGKRPITYHDINTFTGRDLLRNWLIATGLPASRVQHMKLETQVKCFNSMSYLAQVTRAELRKMKLSDGATTADPGIDEQRVKEIVKETIGEITIDEARIADLIKKHVAPKTIEVKHPDGATIKIDGQQHPCFDRALRYTQQGLNVLLVGPAGCGKTHMAEQIAKALDLDYGAIHGTAGASESALTGWLLPGKGGAFEYTPAPFVTLYEEGHSLFLFDEMDAFDPNMLLIVNGALANSHLHIAHRRGKPIVTKGKNVHIMATANTYGTGANPMYAGRAQLDSATLDRFVTITVDYDQALERRLGSAGGLSEYEMNDLWSLRKRVREANLRRVISTRAFQKAAALKRAGDTWKVVIATLVEGWSKDEKAKVGMY